jgi:hypothetical protein
MADATQKSKAQSVRDYIAEHPGATARDVVDTLSKQGVEVAPRYVYRVKSRAKATRPKGEKEIKLKKTRTKSLGLTAKYPRHSLERALRIPKAILEQNAGRECTQQESASFVGVNYNRGPYVVELSSASKFGLLERSSGRVRLTDLARTILHPHDEEAHLKGLRNAVLKAPGISDVYKRYRGENLPEEQPLNNALVAKFRIPQDKLGEFKEIFKQSLEYAKLIEHTDGKYRILDVTEPGKVPVQKRARVRKPEKGVSVSARDTCLVLMPFTDPHSTYYDQIYKPAIEKAGLQPLRADAEIFGAGKAMDQVWQGINAAKVLVAELTTRNPNVLYGLGLAHALRKPLVLVSSNENDVPFDPRNIKVIYYDVNDPFWGTKLIDKVADEILAAIKNPKGAIFKPEQEG